MSITGVIPQIRTTDLATTVRFYTETLGLDLEFEYDDFYAGVRAADHVVHLKLVDNPDPSIPVVHDEDHFHLYLVTSDAAGKAQDLTAKGVEIVKPVHDTPWKTREFAVRDDQGHRIYFGQSLE